MTVLADLTNAASYVWGQCTYYVAQTLSWIPAGLGNAGDWLANARAQGFPTGSTPVPGAVAVYAPGSGYSQFGHVAVVTSGLDPAGQFGVSEMNYKGVGIVDQRQSTMADIAGFIYPPGTDTSRLQLAGLAGLPVGSVGSTDNLKVGTLPVVGDVNLSKDIIWRGGLILAGLALVLIGLVVTFGKTATALV